jgi:hypothetical protein
MLSGVPRSFEASATLYQSTLPNISENPAIPLKEPQIHHYRNGFDDSIRNIEYETPVIKCLGEPPNQAVTAVAARTRRLANYNFVFKLFHLYYTTHRLSMNTKL